MEKRYLHIINNWKALTLLCLVIFSFEEVQSSSEENIGQNPSSFYSNGLIFVAENAFLSIHTEYIEIKKPMISDGTLHISSDGEVTIKAFDNIQVKNVIVENTTLLVEEELHVNRLELKNSTIQLNEFNLFTETKIILTGNSKIDINGMGLCFVTNEDIPSNEVQIVPISTNNFQAILIYEENVSLKKSSIKFYLKEKIINNYNLNRIIVPPPKMFG